MALKIRSIALTDRMEPRTFCRCKTKFTPEGEVFASDRFTPAQIKVLQAEKKYLVVETVPDPPVPEKKK